MRLVLLLVLTALVEEDVPQYHHELKEVEVLAVVAGIELLEVIIAGVASLNILLEEDGVEEITIVLLILVLDSGLSSSIVDNGMIYSEEMPSISLVIVFLHSIEDSTQV